MASPNNSNHRVAQHRLTLREAGMRPIQIWVPDTRGLAFNQKAQEQSRQVAQADSQDHTLDTFLDAALADLEESEGPDQK